MANPTLTALTALTAYAGTFEKQLMGQLYKELNLQADGIRVLPGISNKTTMPRLRVGKGLKPYTGKFVSSDDQFKYSDRSIMVERVQRDVEIDPEKYRTTYLAESVAASYGSNANKEAQIPFAAFMWQEFMKENAQEVVEMLYHGKGKAAFATFNPATAYAVGALVNYSVNVGGKSETQYFRCITVTTAGQDPVGTPANWEKVDYLALTKGFGQIIIDAINNEGFNQIVNTGVINANTAIDQFKAVFRKQLTQVKQEGATIYCSYSNFEKLLDGIGTRNIAFQQTDNITYLPETDRKAIIKPVYWLGDSNRLICTKANNLTLATDQLSDMNKLTNIPQHYTLESSLSFLIGTQIADLDVLTINDQY